MTEIEELLTNCEMLDKISNVDYESPFKINPPRVVPLKRVSIEEQPKYEKSPRPYQSGNENGKSPRLKRIVESPIQNIHPVQYHGKSMPKNNGNSPKAILRENIIGRSPSLSDKLFNTNRDTSRRSPSLSEKVLHNNRATDSNMKAMSPSSVHSGKSSAGNLPDRQNEHLYGTSFQTFQSTMKKHSRVLRPRIEDDIYDDIDICKTPSLDARVLINNNTPEDDVIDSPFQTVIEEEEKSSSSSQLDKDALKFSFSDSNDSLDKSPDCSMMTPFPPPLFDMDGHGCKCPRRLRCSLEILGFLFLLAYLFMTPFIMFRTYEILSKSEAKLREIEIPLRHHLANPGKETLTLASKQTKSKTVFKGTNEKEKTRVISRGFIEYKANVFYKMDQVLEEMRDVLIQLNLRYVQCGYFIQLFFNYPTRRFANTLIKVTLWGKTKFQPIRLRIQ